jgi:inosine triphosphate pyrophosphatase
MTTTSGDASRLREFVFVTGNKNKLREVQQILGDHIQSASLDLEEIQGDARDIVRRKAMLAASHLERVVLVEDVSLCITALGGLPGPYIKWFVDKLGPAGLARMLVGFDDKSAEAHCTFALCAPNEEPIIFVGRCPGRIVDAPRSAPDNLHPFGFDPIFQPDGFDLTYAELPSATKNSISHRGRALQLLQQFFATTPPPVQP